MGSFSVRVDGRAVKQEELVARHARELLALLVIVKEHCVVAVALSKSFSIQILGFVFL